MADLTETVLKSLLLFTGDGAVLVLHISSSSGHCALIRQIHLNVLTAGALWGPSYEYMCLTLAKAKEQFSCAKLQMQNTIFMSF